jgi:hypothetical protein
MYIEEFKYYLAGVCAQNTVITVIVSSLSTPSPSPSPSPQHCHQHHIITATIIAIIIGITTSIIFNSITSSAEAGPS